MPGPPAEVLPLDGYVLVTIRDPGLLLVMKELPGNELREERRIQLAADAWGIAITPDETTVIVTSAWTHTVAGIEWQTGKVVFTLDVAREPRAVIVQPNGKTAYVSHLTSADLTRIDGLSGQGAKATAIAFPAAPMRTPLGAPVEGALGYSLVMDESGNRLLAARHALGGLAERAWGPIPTIDVLQTQNDQPLLAPHSPDRRIAVSPAFAEIAHSMAERMTHVNETVLWNPDYRVAEFSAPRLDPTEGVQPRAMIVAHRTQTVWVASEGDDAVIEYPLMAAAPGERSLRAVGVGRQYRDPKIVGNGESHSDGIPGHCGAPTGLSFDADETMLYVFCRSTYDIATIRIDAVADDRSFTLGKDDPAVTIARVANDPMDETVSRGRRLFYGARDETSSGGLGCAGCHPDGRDDGHVWHELGGQRAGESRLFLATKNLAISVKDGKLGYPRQTPMLAGRVDAPGPYGWHGEAATLRDRLAEGFGLHRWLGSTVDAKTWMVGERAIALTAFLQKGLAPPPKLGRELSEVEKRGKAVFESEATQCTTCHVPDTGFTNRSIVDLRRLATRPGFEDEENGTLKTPSLLFVGNTGPYLHDGSAPTLASVIDVNGDRMGKTSQLSADDKAALVAYLETL